ncbi:galanin receptor type 1-like [Stylophora pistillata]|uniref:galanin receptor type 1-like n=1 Tax=Stylophora pistillata TaxID=50429 RepID=UPI000C04334D|nr:galanin receptor type 1-like [Stylophora pistillata]
MGDVHTSTQCTFGLISKSLSTKLGLTIVYVIVFIVALSGNCVIILIAKTKRRLRKVAFNYFIISMAVADILDALVAVPMTVWHIYMSNHWFEGLIGDITCKFFNVLFNTSLVASIFTLVAISADRYLAIVHVMREPPSKTRVKLGVVSVWLLTAVMSLPYMVKYKFRPWKNGRYFCYGRWSDDSGKNLYFYKYEVTARFIFFYAFPLIVIAALYSLIIQVLKKRQAFGENMSQLRIQRQNITVIKMLVTVVLLFAFSWLPAHVVSMMIAFAPEKIYCWPISLLYTLLVPGHANGALNPCIYIIFNENYRKGLRQLLVRCQRKTRNRIPTWKIKQWPTSSTLERDPSRGGIKGFFRQLSKEKSTETDEVFVTQL